jgi:hypothetical protein
LASEAEGLSAEASASRSDDVLGMLEIGGYDFFDDAARRRFHGHVAE